MKGARVLLGLLVLAAGTAWILAGGAATFAGLGAAVVAGAVGAAAVLRGLPRPAAAALAVLAGAGAAWLALSLHEDLRGERPWTGGPLAPAPSPAGRPPPASPTVRLLVWGDCRGGITVQERLCDAIRERAPDWTIGLGDFVGMARVYQFEILKHRLAATGVPLLAVPGNHDLDPFGTLGPYSRVFGPGRWAVTDRDVLLVGLDSARGSVSAEDVAFAERARASSRRLVLCLHHPLWAPGDRGEKPLPQDDPATKALQALCEERDALVLCSHWHGWDVRRVGRATQVTTGGAGSRLEYDGTYHCAWIELGDGAPSIRKIDLARPEEISASLDRWKTFRDEAAWAARERPLGVALPYLLLALALGAAAAALRRHGTR